MNSINELIYIIHTHIHTHVHTYLHIAKVIHTYISYRGRITPRLRGEKNREKKIFRHLAETLRAFVVALLELLHNY